jgi:glutamate-1-semialdehyde 2,1-aminomutase
VIDRAEGSRLWDIDGREYVDGLGAFGPMLLGHRHPEVIAAVSEQLERGLMFGSAVTDEGAVAEHIVACVPGAEKVVMLASGTEATMAALRLARAATGRDNIAKFTGGWHGSHDAVLQGVWSVAGDPSDLRALAEGPGIPPFVSDHTVVLPWNDLRAFDRIRREADALACVIIELIQGGACALPADRSFVQELRAVCDECGVLLVIDEVLTGFRLGLSGASGLYGVTGDLVSLGKIIAGGMPGAAVTGRADIILQNLDPLDHTSALRDQTVLMAGTNAGHPVSMVAGRATLQVLIRDQDTIYPHLFALGERLRGVSVK